MTIYIDSNYRCHATNAEGRKEIQTEFFNGKCEHYIEGFRLVPFGESWTREDGEVFFGKMISPAVPYETLEPYQKQYEEDQEILNIITGEVSADDES